MLTGDSRAVGDEIAQELGLDTAYSELLPHQKVEQLEAIEAEKQTKGRLVFVGDGINDAPVLARSDVGIAMGGVGADAAIEAADVVIMNDSLSKLAEAIDIARSTRRIVWQNIVLALGIKTLVLILAALGIATMWAAVFADVGVALLATLNATRAGKIA
jgi:Cd2+/Zn2+-exporting ATPase